ncbi:MAG: peptidylprolyl isomerase, partial [Chloroflexi bacterium]|nr:peptidylprolyl isomerase [Chloroflexota bacterium]
MPKSEDNLPNTPDEQAEGGAKQRPDRMRPQRSQPSAPRKKSGAVAPPVNSAALRRPPRQSQAAEPQPMTRRQANRHQKDLQHQQQLVIATAVVVGLIVLVLLIGIFQSLIGPNIKTLAEVNGQTVSSGDYYKYRKIQLFKEIGQLQQQSSYVQGDQLNQLKARVQLDQTELGDITNHDVDQATLTALVSNLIAEKAAKDLLGITVSDEDLNNYLKDLFLSTIYTPTPNATGIPATATAESVSTAMAGIATATADNTTPLPTATPSVSPTITSSVVPSTTVALTPQPTGSANSTPGATTTANLTPGATISGTITATTTVTPTANITATATVTPTATLTPSPIANDKIQATISASRQGFLDSFKKATGLSEDDYKKWELRPQFVKRQVSQQLLSKLAKVGDPYPQLKASHILLKDEATAKDILAQLKAVPAAQLESKFIELARDKSEDKTAAAHNGDVGWFIEGTMVDPFYQAALKLEVKQLSDPVKSDFGYHIIWLTDKNDTRPLDAVEYNQLAKTDQNGDYAVYTKWLKQQVDAAKTKYNTSPTPTTVPTQVPAPVFTPVIPPTETMLPIPTLPVATAAAPVVTTTSGITTTGTTAVAGTTSAATTAVAGT